MHNGWRALSWEYVCDQAPGIETARETAAAGTEYGINYYEFINTAEGLGKYANEWWDGLQKEERRRMLVDRVAELEGALVCAKTELKENEV
jgi:hypothetical protein